MNLRAASFSGTAEERGRRHGELFGEAVRRSGIIDFYLDYPRKNFAESDSLAARGLFGALHGLTAARFSKQARGLISGFCRGAGFKKGAVARALAMPDVFNALIGTLGQAVAAVPALGCTSVAAWGDCTADGSFLYGRNLDFPGNRIWDQCPLLARQKPDRGIPYVSVGTAGGILDGITGVNAEGLTVAIHQHLCRDATLFFGRPILDIATEALQFARTIDEAAAICVKTPPSSSWTMVLTHWKERRAALLELSPRRQNMIVLENGTLARTNCYIDPSLKERELDYPCWRESSRVRRARAEEFLSARKGRLDARGIAEILSDHIDMDRGRVRAFAQTIAQPHNMTSVVFEPEKGVAWVADGKAPACQGPYRKIALWEDAACDEILDVKDPLSPKKRQGFERYLDAFAAWQERRDAAGARAHLADSMAADAEEPTYRYLSGLLSARLGDWKSALDFLEQAASFSDYPHRTQAELLWQARALEVLGRRSAAESIYQDLAESALKPGLARAARRGLDGPYSAKTAARIRPDFLYADVFRY